MEPLGLVQGRGFRHPSSLWMDVKHAWGAEPSWGKNPHNSNTDCFWGTSHVMNEKEEAQRGEGTCPQVTQMLSPRGARLLNQAFRFQAQGSFSQALCLSAENLYEF